MNLKQAIVIVLGLAAAAWWGMERVDFTNAFMRPRFADLLARTEPLFIFGLPAAILLAVWALRTRGGRPAEAPDAAEGAAPNASAGKTEAYPESHPPDRR